MTGWNGSRRAARLPGDWKSRRAKVLRRDPICRICQVNRSTDVDHVRRGDDHDDANLQGLCAPCHQAKTITERSAPRLRPPTRHPGRTPSPPHEPPPSAKGLTVCTNPKPFPGGPLRACTWQEAEA